MKTMTETTEQNRNRLSILVSVFDLSLEEVSKVIGLSRSMLSRTLHGHSGINPEQVYARLEKHLPEIIAKRGKAFFQVEAVEVERVEELRKAS
jgi:transcriptional regulator with XRE-family HTH domain